MKTRKELKDEYKQRKTQMGVFEIRNTVNNKIFIDSSTDVNAKWNRHQLQLKMGMHVYKALQNDWNTQGAQDFEFNVLSEIKHQDEGNPDYNKELVLLEELVRDELQLDENLAY
ncbi:MAG: GIY-YIG nuclease family protein [Balneolaceae bacterium]